MLRKIFKSVLEQDRTPIVICDTNHTILYMNEAACVHYKNLGDNSLEGRSLLDCHNEKSCEMIKKIVAWFQESKGNNRIFTYRNEKENKDVYMVALRDEKGVLIGYYEKHEYRNIERAKLYDFSKSL